VILTWGQLVLGGLVLYLGAEWLVKGAAGMARSLGLRPLVVGLTVVAYGTSAPELTVGLASALEDKGPIALGNSIGSNIANLGLILGITALISPPRVDGALIRREIPMLVLATALLPLVFLDGALGRIEATLMLVAAVVYTWWMIARTPASSVSPPAVMEGAVEAAGAPKGEGRARMAVIALVGLVLLVGGGKLFVDAAVEIARAAGMSERVVGLTIVSVGTSLPELAASLVAAMRGHADLAVGNIIGSNIFNIVFILGAAGLARPLHADLGTMALDLGFLGAMTAVAAISMRAARTISRVEGALLILAYVAFLIALLLS
jgi:cation:H+ antiporter